MNRNKIESTEKIYLQILHLGILIDIFAPIIVFFFAVLLRERLIHIQSIKELNLLFYVLLIISFSEIAAIFIFKKRFWEPFIQKKAGLNPESSVEHNLVTFGIVIYTLCFSPALYGLVYYLLGGTWEHFALFIAITFLSFQLFKPKPEELERLTRDLNISGNSF
jgi:hypothetical protein